MFNYAYCSDKYQYTMGKSFYDNGMKDKRAIFNLFFRKAPDNNNWAVVSGVKEALEMIHGLGKMPEEFFEKFLPGQEYQDFRQYLSNMHFTGNVYAMREGEIAFPNQPVIIVEGPIIEAQVLETPLLCIMNHQMAIATKASRVSRSTSKPVSEFGSRRAHGPWAATFGAKASVIGGCVNSSNILAATEFGFESSGTMAHSYISSFGCSVHGEYDAFDTYIKSHLGEPIILLIDTYDTLKCGIRNAIKAFKANNIDDKYCYYGIRLDSGDLAYLSKKCRIELDKAGLSKCRIVATNSLDEYLIPELELQKADIDSYGVGDAIATSKHNPCFGNVYKLVQIDNQPVLKRSEDKAKLINPGFQITYRITSKGYFKTDVTCLRGDSLSQLIEAGETITVRDEYDESKALTFNKGSYSAKALQSLMMESGVTIYQEPTIQEKRDYYLENLKLLNPTEKRLVNPHYYKLDISDDLFDLKTKLINSIIEEINAFDHGNNMNVTHIVIDMLYDFIDGSLACPKGEEAVEKCVEYINSHPEQRILYVCDSHPSDHCSFMENGGIWPAHCVEGTRGGAIHESFFRKVEKIENRPDSRRNIFYKGRDAGREQYSGFEAMNNKGESIESNSAGEIIVSGIATEYCVKSTVLDFIEKGHSVSILEKGTAYINFENHLKTLDELRNKGVKII